MTLMSDTSTIVDRKAEEAEFHNRLRDPQLRQDPKALAYLTSNRKYYAVATPSETAFTDWLFSRCAGKDVLDFACGDGRYSRLLAHGGARVVGIDISDVSVENCRRRAEEEGIADRATFQVMDCEQLEFADGTFDIVCESGALHHLDLKAAMREIARVLKPTGEAICLEAVGHNPIIQAYRRLTPHLRTKYETEHILRMRDVAMMRELFGRVDVRFFHLASLLAVPFRNTPLFEPLRRTLDSLDSVLTRIPGVREQSWIMILFLSEPRKR